MCYFSIKFCFFLFIWRLKFAFGGWWIFWLLFKYLGGKFGVFSYKIVSSSVCLSCKDPFNKVDYRRTHFSHVCWGNYHEHTLSKLKNCSHVATMAFYCRFFLVHQGTRIVRDNRNYLVARSRKH